MAIVELDNTPISNERIKEMNGAFISMFGRGSVEHESLNIYFEAKRYGQARNYYESRTEYFYELMRENE